jgi:hypothetical protein
MQARTAGLAEILIGHNQRFLLLHEAETAAIDEVEGPAQDNNPEVLLPLISALE